MLHRPQGDALMEVIIRYSSFRSTQDDKRAEIYIAGSETHGVNLMAVIIMQEDSIDLSGHTSNNLEEYRGIEFDYVITVCDNTKERCPFFLAKRSGCTITFPILPGATGTAEEIQEQFRQVRTLIKTYCMDFVNNYLQDWADVPRLYCPLNVLISFTSSIGLS